ncbi:homeo box A7 (mapped), isoform CRA_b [Rattus norvegicus]|uniref:Homeo box A7 (Mapped), isoform CRA_b n=1 Tax=Rattus norvegicus TaxID=10116 RepID=A6K0R1_RAT|nr:homeo box A7 (mapped), isoform CRA_b [Rattus norvegicus]
MVPVCARLEETPRLQSLRWGIKSALKRPPAHRQREAATGRAPAPSPPTCRAYTMSTAPSIRTPSPPATVWEPTPTTCPAPPTTKTSPGSAVTSPKAPATRRTRACCTARPRPVSASTPGCAVQDPIGSGDARPTLATRRWSWRRNSTSTAT